MDMSLRDDINRQKTRDANLAQKKAAEHQRKAKEAEEKFLKDAKKAADKCIASI